MWEDDPSRSHEQPHGDEILPFDEFAVGNEVADGNEYAADNEFEHPDDARLRPPAASTLLSRIPAPVLLSTVGVFAATALAAMASFAVGPSHSATSQPQNQGDVPLSTSASLVSTMTPNLAVHSSSGAESSQHGTSGIAHGPGKGPKNAPAKPGETITTTDETTIITGPSHTTRPSTSRTTPACGFVCLPPTTTDPTTTTSSSPLKTS